MFSCQEAMEEKETPECKCPDISLALAFSLWSRKHRNYEKHKQIDTTGVK